MSSIPKKLSKKDVLVTGLLNTLPALLGAAVAGPEAGLAAGQGGSQIANLLLGARAEEEAGAEQEALRQQEAAARMQEQAASREFQMTEAEKDRQLRRDLAAQEMAARSQKDAQEASQKKAPLTKGQEALDRQFAKRYEEFAAGGGEEGLQQKIKGLEEIKQGLSKTDTASGPIVGLLPKSVRDIVTPQGAAFQDRLLSTIQETLRQTLGGQFTEREAQQLFERAYNPRLSEEENIKRVEKVINELSAKGKATGEAARYFEEAGTLSGFKGASEAPATDPKSRLEQLRKKYGR